MRRYLIAGLLVWVPLVITVWVLTLLVGTLDQTLLLLPARWQPERLLGIYIPGLGVLLTFFIVLLTGMFAANLLGQRLVQSWEGLLARIPFVKSVYSSVKQVSDTLFSSSGQAFRKALLVQWPHEGAWTIAFISGTPGGDVVNHIPPDCLSVYVPTTPNPTSGYLEIVPVEMITPTDWTVDQAMSFIISGGAVSPDTIPFSAPSQT